MDASRSEINSEQWILVKLNGNRYTLTIKSSRNIRAYRIRSADLDIMKSSSDYKRKLLVKLTLQ